MADPYLRALQNLTNGQSLPLQAPSGTAHTIRHDAGRNVVFDGPFAETKEQLGGYHLVECRDLDEAVSLAMRIPTLPHGGVVEVRAVEPETGPG